MAGVKEANCEAVLRAGRIEAVITAMHTHLSHADVKHDGCWALNSIACNLDNNHMAVATAGGIEVVITAMCTHPTLMCSTMDD